MELLFFCLFLILGFKLKADTNLGTINTVANGFATVKDCEAESPSMMNGCEESYSTSFKELREFAETNQCLATEAEFKNAGLTLPACPSAQDQIKGLDHTYPTAGMFALFIGDNASFLHNLMSSYLENNKVGRFNVIIPKSQEESLNNFPDLKKLLNSNRVNIIQVETMPDVERWMQDSFEFTSINGKPALYQLEHARESGLTLSDRLACEIAKRCDIPYYLPPDMVDPQIVDQHNLNSGGNLEILPGGTFYRGIIKTAGFSPNHNENKPVPFQTQAQVKQKKSLELAGNKVLDLDTSFLHVGHVDEIINIVKTNAPPPCHFALLLASPQKAFDLLEEKASSYKIKEKVNRYEKPIIFSEPYAGFKIVDLKIEDEAATPIDRCSDKNYEEIRNLGSKGVIQPQEIENIYAADCIDGVPIEEFVQSDEYQILKKENLGSVDHQSIAKVMEQNKNLLLQELKQSTKCEDPKVIEVPVFFRSGLSYTPDLVNGVVETMADSPSKAMLPRTYFKPFDSYIQSALKEVGVETTFIHDMEYHLLHGEVHCGSNSARVCKQ